MEFKRTVRIESPIEEVWALTNELETVASCIPGVSEFQMLGPQVFDCRLVHKVGSVTAKFQLHSELKDVQEGKSLTVESEGSDRALNSNVRSTQTFEFRSDGNATEVDISADLHVNGRIATFGSRLIPPIAERVTVETLNNLAALLDERRGDAAGNS